MKVFVSNVDSPIGYAVSRLLASTTIGSRREDESQQPSGEDDGSPVEDKSIKALEQQKAPRSTYTVIGTLTATRPTSAGNPDYSLTAANPSSPGNLFETNDPKRNLAIKEAIAKFPVPGQKPAWVEQITPSHDKEALKDALLDCDIIIYDICGSVDESGWAAEVLSEVADGFTTQKTFIGVSTVMTWAKTKIESDDSEAFLAEDEYRRQKPHPNFKNHLNVEKSIIKFGKKTMFKTYVVAAGLLYHPADCVFHHFFKGAWLNEPELICYGEGNNIIPTIHLDDLTNILAEVVETSPETRYIVAVDDSKNSLFDILKSISETLGSGIVKKNARDTAFLDNNLSQTDIDVLQLNLRIEPGCIKEMNVEWKYETGIVENIQAIAQEYRDARGLSSLKILVHGPPASGKTFYAKKLAEYYELHYLEPEQIMKDAIETLEKKVARNATAEDPDEDAEDSKDSLNELKELAQQNNGQFPEAKILEFVQARLKSMPCRNQGYVLDGYPDKLASAKEIFKSQNDDDGKEEKGLATCDETIIPDNVITLEASDVFIKDRIMKLPESVVAGTRNAEEALTHRLEEFRANNTDDNTLLNYFDELEIHPLVVPVENVTSEKVFASILKHVGKPHNFGPSPEKLAAKRLLEEQKLAKEQELQELERARREKEEEEKYLKDVEEWKIRIAEVRKQEQDILEAQSLPLRNYLMKHVMPTVTSGLIELCKTRPEDPVDFLAEYLFKHNPDNN